MPASISTSDFARTAAEERANRVLQEHLVATALDKTLHGQGLGGVLLADAVQRIVVATQTVAARFVVVDAIDQAAHGFYLHHGFREIPTTMRLVQKISDIAEAIGS